MINILATTALLAAGLTAPAAPVISAELLPGPAGTAVDVSPLGVVVGTAQGIPQRWAKLPRAGWVRQQLGTTPGTVAGVTDLGEAAGTVNSQAVRWSVSGLTATVIPGTRVDAIGARGTAGVYTAGSEPLGESDLVDRDGTRTALRGTPELDAGYRRTVASVGSSRTAVVWVTNGIGKGTTARPVLWRDGATLRLPVFSSFFLSNACVSRVLPDGTVVSSGFSNDSGTPTWLMTKHVGGVPGTDVVLNRATASGQPIAGLTCDSTQSSLNTLAADGGIAGRVDQQAAYWDPAGTAHVVPLAAGEVSAIGAAASTRGRIIVKATEADGTVRLALWRAGERTPLATPPGWAVRDVVELTDAGLLVANVSNAEGETRPAAWHLPRQG
ncbi:hypothetical protein KOI35_08775 [Actinoplanes bogorensis]|uniref:HAF family extracellular repeat protein n=1 Tax=Paractinoplanes bogorensis TaxID=1610840 RepID=A0ABS5YJF6_9ACTN|nr:hypothetical protein [Actinoplanes bogorensis]MBU2663598.1 hypothetical protein [Actinoplanes bogorensis]